MRAVVRRILTPSYLSVGSTASNDAHANPARNEPWGNAAAQPGKERQKSSGSPLGITLLSLVGIAGVSGLVFGAYIFGASVGRESAKSSAPHQETEAMAFQALQNLIAETPGAPSIRYAAGMAAMMADYHNEARRLLEGSISGRDRVSDSLALKAAVEGVSGT